MAPQLAILALTTLCAAYCAAPGGRHTDQVRQQLTVATFNVQHGTDQRGRYDLNRTIQAIASLDADLIGVQELVRNHVRFRCDDQPALIAEGLSRSTGRPWRHVYVNEWVTQNRECLEDGRGDGVETEGLAFFTDQPALEVDHVRLWASRVGLAARVPSAPDTAVIVTHLASGSDARDTRQRQLATLLPWAQKQAPLRILMGDLNASPEAPELAPVFQAYRDAWLLGGARSWLGGLQRGETRPGRPGRIDYVLFAPDTRLDLVHVEVVHTARLLKPWEASDHRPVVATFDIAGPPHR